MKITKTNMVSFKSITPVYSTKSGFEALRKEAAKEGKTKYILSCPKYLETIDYPADKVYTSYLITDKEYKKYSTMQFCKELVNAGIYDQNRVPVTITERSKSLIKKLINRI